MLGGDRVSSYKKNNKSDYGFGVMNLKIGIHCNEFLI